jgi:hypothetical protein
MMPLGVPLVNFGACESALDAACNFGEFSFYDVEVG